MTGGLGQMSDPDAHVLCYAKETAVVHPLEVNLGDLCALVHLSNTIH